MAALAVVVAEGEADHVPAQLRAARIAGLAAEFK